MFRPVACDYSPLCFQSFGIRVQMYGFVNKFVVRKTGLEVVESYLDIYARIESSPSLHEQKLYLSLRLRIELRLRDEGPLIA